MQSLLVTNPPGFAYEGNITPFLRVRRTLRQSFEHPGARQPSLRQLVMSFKAQCARDRPLPSFRIAHPFTTTTTTTAFLLALQGGYPVAERRKQLSSTYGFKCNCPRCKVSYKKRQIKIKGTVEHCQSVKALTDSQCDYVTTLPHEKPDLLTAGFLDA